VTIRYHPELMRILVSVATVIFLSVLAGFTMVGGEQVVNGQAARSVWDGVFTAAQAERGRGFYLANCAECHGGNLEGGEKQALKGDRFWSDWQETTVDYMLGRISKNMPFSEDGSLAGTLGNPTYVDIVAHILNTNGFPAGGSELTAASSAGVQIVKKGGPSELPDNSFAHVVGCLAKGEGRDWKLTRGSRPARVFESQSPDANAPLGDREFTLKFVLTSLDKYAGYRMSVRATLMGEGGRDGLNVRGIAPVSATCE
jgi:mono/diheme cytochrome c family protein